MAAVESASRQPQPSIRLSMDRNGVAVDAGYFQEASDDFHRGHEADCDSPGASSVTKHLSGGNRTASRKTDGTFLEGHDTQTPKPSPDERKEDASEQDQKPSEHGDKPNTGEDPKGDDQNGCVCQDVTPNIGDSCADTNGEESKGNRSVRRVIRISSDHRQTRNKVCSALGNGRRTDSRANASESGNSPPSSHARGKAPCCGKRRGSGGRESLLSFCLPRSRASAPGAAGEKVAGFYVKDVGEVLKFLQGKASEPTFLLREPPQKTLLWALSDPLVLLSFYLHLEEIRIGRILTALGYKSPSE
ncbi:phosphatidylinositol-4-phosphate 5-Kinase [Toxoplasma gondii VAND]|uniref:Phosphatidylinositol-4-phosphate 5-Kinase n=1 Tax=Toxoplasma gondii VAND TaxID=933077 RepID=A0A086QIX4_TOXGO|nr:phosphatidylinositol-4-phosphate 5-Kinase [Toxoplasma gondii VAND]